MENVHAQQILSFPAVFEPAPEGGYNVSFPAFSGCVTFGSTFEKAKQKAHEVLELWLEELAEQHIQIPAHAHRPIIDEVMAVVPEKASVQYATSQR